MHFQSHLNTHETLQSKKEFEENCRDHGVIIGSYHSDNGSCFTSAEYTRHLETFRQTTTFASVGGHHHNGVAERAIRTITSMARTMMLHQGIHWPEMADPQLWPMAVKHAVHVYNHVPREDNGLSPYDIFTRTCSPTKRLHDLHVWGCPVYVLHGDLADGKKIPRWKARSQRHILIGLSDKHPSSAPLVLNPHTGTITTKFHVIYDDWFATVATRIDELPPFHESPWADLFGTSEAHYDDELDNSDPQEMAPPERVQRHMSRVADTYDRNQPPMPLDIPPPPVEPPDDAYQNSDLHQREMCRSTQQSPNSSSSNNQNFGCHSLSSSIFGPDATPAYPFMPFDDRLDAGSVISSG